MNEKLYNYAELGREVADRWGVPSECDISKTVDGMSETRTMLCLLAAIVEKLQCVDGRIINQQMEIKLKDKRDEHPVSHGCFVALHQFVDPLVPRWPIELSVRARRALSYFQFMSQLTKENLIQTKNCGPSTTAEILEWKDNGRVK